MSEGKTRNKKMPKVPPEALDHVWREIETLGDPRLDVEKLGRFCYITHAGSPLCRLAYRGEMETWDFAIYKYSTGSYANSVFGFSRYGTVAKLVATAMNAYNLT